MRIMMNVALAAMVILAGGFGGAIPALAQEQGREVGSMPGLETGMALINTDIAVPLFSEGLDGQTSQPVPMVSVFANPALVPNPQMPIAEVGSRGVRAVSFVLYGRPEESVVLSELKLQTSDFVARNYHNFRVEVAGKPYGITILAPTNEALYYMTGIEEMVPAGSVVIDVFVDVNRDAAVNVSMPVVSLLKVIAQGASGTYYSIYATEGQMARWAPDKPSH